MEFIFFTVALGSCLQASIAVAKPFLGFPGDGFSVSRLYIFWVFFFLVPIDGIQMGFVCFFFFPFLWFLFWMDFVHGRHV